MRLTRKLMARLHRVFSPDPGPWLALRFRRTSGAMTWRIADARLTTTVPGDPSAALDLDLTQYTVAGLANAISAAAGYEVLYLDGSDLAALSARVLLDSEGDPDATNGDHLYGYTSLAYGYMEAMALELARAQDQIPEALKQLSVRTAEGEWLDELGSYYGVPRSLGESDAVYGERIVAEALRPRANNVAIEAALLTYTGQPATVIDVQQPADVVPVYDATWDHDGTITHGPGSVLRYGLFDVVYSQDVFSGGDRTAFTASVRAVIERMRAAGTQLRALLLREPGVSDPFPFSPTESAGMPITVSPDLGDTVAGGAESESVKAGALSLGAEPGPDGNDSLVLTVVFDITYSGVRRYDGTARHLGGAGQTETL